MGTWGVKAYESDDAADWFADMLKTTKLRETVVASLKAGHTREGAGGIRAAASVLTMLAKTYTWPPGQIEGDLDLAVKALEDVRASLRPRTDQAYFDELDHEIAVLSLRLAKVRKYRADRRREASKKAKNWVCRSRK